MQSFARMTAKVGVVTGGVGVGIVAGFKPALDKLGEQAKLADLADVFNLSGEAASRLFGIMGAGGSDLRDAQEALATFGQRVNDAVSGKGEEAATLFKELGVSAQEFVGLGIDQQFYKLLTAIKASTSPLGKLGLLMKSVGEDSGKNLSSILGLSADEMGRLGDAMETSTADLKLARDATRAQTFAAAQLSRVWGTIATAIAPNIAEFAEIVQRNVGPVVEWARANSELISTVFKVGGSLVVAGGAFLALGAAGSAFASATGGIIAGWLSLKAIVGGTLGMLLSPLGLVTAAVAGLGYLFVTQTETGRTAFASLKAGFWEVATVAGEAFGGIVAAVKKGDLQLAGEIAMTALELGWAATVAKMTNLWNGFKSVFVDGWHEATDGTADILREMAGIAREAFVEIGKNARFIFDEVSERLQFVADKLRSAFAGVKDTVSDVVAAVAPILAPLAGPFLLLADLVGQAWDGVSTNIAESLNNLASWTEKSFVKAAAAIENTFRRAARVALDTALDAAKGLDSLDPTDSLKGAIAEVEALRARVAGDIDPTAEVKKIEDARKAFEDEMKAKRKEAKAAREAGRLEDSAKADAAVADIKVKLDALVAEAGKPGAGALEPDFGGGGDFGAGAAAGVARAATAAGSRGTFSGANISQRFGADTVEKKALKAAEATADNTKETVKAVLQVAKGLRFK